MEENVEWKCLLWDAHLSSHTTYNRNLPRQHQRSDSDQSMSSAELNPHYQSINQSNLPNQLQI